MVDRFGDSTKCSGYTTPIFYLKPDREKQYTARGSNVFGAKHFRHRKRNFTEV